MPRTFPAPLVTSVPGSVHAYHYGGAPKAMLQSSGIAEDRSVPLRHALLRPAPQRNATLRVATRLNAPAGLILPERIVWYGHSLWPYHQRQARNTDTHLNTNVQATVSTYAGPI